jgi:hypothetical protein
MNRIKTTALLLLAPVALLSACTRQSANALADGKVLCDPATGQAYYVRPGAGDISFIRPIAATGTFCQSPIRKP